MNIIREDIDSLNAVIKVKVSQEDYTTPYENAVKTYQKKAAMPGFRPGKVPAGLIKKMYGKALLVEEINKMLNDTLYKYLQENNIEVLGNPLPKANEENPIDFDTQKEFEFLYELGLAPQFEISLSKESAFLQESVKIDDALINKQIEDIAKRYGNIVSPEAIEENDLVLGEFVELDSSGEILAGGIFKSSSLAMDRIKNEEIKKKLLGLKKDDKVVLEAKKISDNATDLSAMLGIEKAAAEKINSNVQFTVKNIGRVKPAELNTELFDKIYGPGIIKTEEELRGKIKTELGGMFAEESDKKLKVTIMESLLKTANISLPDEFLKRWMIAVNEKPVTYEQVNNEYDMYSRSLKWQLIENKLLKQNDIKVSNDEVVNYIKDLIKEQYARYGKTDFTEQELDETTSQILKNEEEVKKIYNRLYEARLMDLFKQKYTIQSKEVSYDEFYDIKK